MTAKIQKITERAKQQRIFFRGYWLTRKQWQVYNLLIQGYTPREIRKMIYITKSTMHCHLDTLYKTFNVRSFLELVVLYYRGKVKEE